MDTLIATQKMVPLAPLTTLEVGGPATEFLPIRSEQEALEAVNWWRSTPEPTPILFLGGGSNLLVSDRGFDGLVLKMENASMEVVGETDGRVLVKVGAGTVWDDFVAHTVERGWAGVECLSGIPGCVGAAPVQNIGAYGQEVSETICLVEGVDARSGERFQRNGSECDFSYRDSFFKRARQGRYLITSVTFSLCPEGVPTIRYQDLLRRVDELPEKSLRAVRELVIEIRRTKSMVYDKADPNHRSAGSFFTNPIVPVSVANSIQSGLPADTVMPRFAHGNSTVKLSAAWLIDNSGLGKGFRHKPDTRVSLSTNHVLALTNRGGATAADLLELKNHVQAVVKDRFGVWLEPEPNFIGFAD